MTTILGIAAAMALAIGAAFATAPRDAFETGIFIAAPPKQVWNLLTDPSEHVRWNPAMRSIEGRFAVGEHPSLTMETGSGRPVTFRPEILIANPGAELRWRGRLGLPRLFDGEHYFLLFAEDGGTRLVHGERFHGLLLWFVDVQQFRPGFEAANEGLKARAEEQASAG
ncbi:MAG: SRPBCC family protein [Roseinatronobacter sp.]